MVTRVYKRSVNKTTQDPKASHWSEKQKLEAVTTYLMVGKWPIVSDQTGIPIDTLKKWKQADWWKEAEDEVRRSSNLEVGGKLKRIIEKAASLVEDRLENGDLAFNPSTGGFVRKPLGAKIASEILVKSIDRNLLMEKLNERPQLKEEAIMDRLKNIEQALIRGARRKIEVIDITPIEEQDVQSERDNSTGGLLPGISGERSNESKSSVLGVQTDSEAG